MNLPDDIAERERLETRRELRYALMRLARIPGHLFFWGGIITVCYGLIFFLLGLPEALGEMMFGPDPTAELIFKGRPYFQTLYGAGWISIGFLGIALGPAITVPYSVETTMPSTYDRVCHDCGKPLPKEWIIYWCPECTSLFPLGLGTFVLRLISVFATVINISILLLGVILFLR